jgi:hypothetical protein
VCHRCFFFVSFFNRLLFLFLLKLHLEKHQLWKHQKYFIIWFFFCIAFHHNVTFQKKISRDVFYFLKIETKKIGTILPPLQTWTSFIDTYNNYNNRQKNFFFDKYGFIFETFLCVIKWPICTIPWKLEVTISLITYSKTILKEKNIFKKNVIVYFLSIIYLKVQDSFELFPYKMFSKCI